MDFGTGWMKKFINKTGVNYRWQKDAGLTGRHYTDLKTTDICVLFILQGYVLN